MYPRECASIIAQVLYGSIVGTVTDQTGALIPGVQIHVTNQQTGFTRTGSTEAVGNYSITNLPVDVYTVEATASGFRIFKRSDVQVRANEVNRVNLNMEIGQLTEQIVVAADATQLQTDKSDTHTTISSEQVRSLPLPGYRNYESLINLVPGVTPTRFQNSPTDTPGRSLFTNINGTPRNSNTTRIDGAASVNIWLPHHAGYVIPAEMVETVNSPPRPRMPSRAWRVERQSLSSLNQARMNCMVAPSGSTTTST